jgi:hypothetical protein
MHIGETHSNLETALGTYMDKFAINHQKKLKEQQDNSLMKYF